MDATRISAFTAFDETHQLTFRNPSLLHQAFVHRSYLNEQIINDATLEDNERLEFLGDSVLGFVVSDLLYRRFPNAREGELTHMRTLLVRRETLAALARRLCIGDLLLLGVGEEESGGRLRPATLCASLEALVGALFLDQGIERVRSFLMPHLEQMMAPMRATLMPKDPKSRLQEWSQRTVSSTPRYRVVENSGPDHLKTFVTVVTLKNEPVGVGKGHSKQDASQAAAASALFRVGEEAPEYVPEPELEARHLPKPEVHSAGVLETFDVLEAAEVTDALA